MSQPKVLSNNRHRFVVAARGGDPAKVSPEQYEKEYSGFEEEVLARYPGQDLAELRKKTGDERYDSTVSQGFLQEKANEAAGVPGTSKSADIPVVTESSGRAGSSGEPPIRK